MRKPKPGAVMPLQNKQWEQELKERIGRSFPNPLLLSIEGVGTFKLFIETDNAVEVCLDAFECGKAKHGPFVALFEEKI